MAILIMLLIFFSDTLGADQSFELDFFGAEERRIISEKEKSLSNKIEENSENIFYLTGNYSTINEKFGADMGFQIAKRRSNESDKNLLYLKDNAYAAFFAERFQLNIGRKIFAENKSFQWSTKDGVEGVSVGNNFGKYLSVDIYLYDYYRGFPVLERNLIVNKNESCREEGKRSRHGLSLNYEKEKLFANIQILYLNMGSWGKFSQDDRQKNLTGTGDGDFLYHAAFQVGKKWESLSVKSSVVFSRGLDKSVSNPVRQEKSIPISGELLLLGANWSGNIFSLKFEAFLPDSDKANKQGEILEMGFVGMGTNPVESILVSQSLNFYPSQWITPYGFEKSDSNFQGRKNSLYLKSDVIVKFREVEFDFGFEKIVPREDQKQSKGEISFQKRDYSKESLTALTFSVQSAKKEDSNFFLKFSASKLFSPKETGLSSTLLYLSAGIRFL